MFNMVLSELRAAWNDRAQLVEFNDRRGWVAVRVTAWGFLVGGATYATVEEAAAATVRLLEG